MDGGGGVAGGVGCGRQFCIDRSGVFARRIRFFRGDGFGRIAVTTFAAAAKAPSRETTLKPRLAKVPSGVMFVFCARVGSIPAGIVKTASGKERLITRERKDHVRVSQIL